MLLARSLGPTHGVVMVLVVLALFGRSGTFGRFTVFACTSRIHMLVRAQHCFSVFIVLSPANSKTFSPAPPRSANLSAISAVKCVTYYMSWLPRPTNYFVMGRSGMQVCVLNGLA